MARRVVLVHEMGVRFLPPQSPSIRLRRYARPPWRSSLTVLIMAAGRGTRMRRRFRRCCTPSAGARCSTGPSPPRARPAPNASSAVVAPGRGRRPRAAGRRRGRRADRRRGTGSAVLAAPRPTSSRPSTVIVLSGDLPLIVARPDRGARRAARARTAPRPRCSPPRSSTRPGYGRIVRDADGGRRADRRDQAPRGRRPPRSSRSARSTSAPTPSRPSRCSRRSTRSSRERRASAT